jgi:geranylgeranyl pyrophosphate synthase
VNLNQIYKPIALDLKKVEIELAKVIQVDDPLLAQLLDYSIKNGGKRIRPVFTLLSGKFKNYNLDKLVPMAAGVELLHGATLIHDDIIDNADLRRNKRTIHKVWGSSAALLLGDYLFAKAASIVAGTGNLRVIKLFAQTLMTISGGELAQINVVFDAKRIREHYYRWISAKTARLFATSTESGAVLSDADEETTTALKQFGHYFGMTFQVVDDVLDFTGKEADLGKPVGSDLVEGAVTLPSILFAETSEGNKIIKDIIEKRNVENIHTAIKKIRSSSIIEQCIEIANEFSSKAKKCLEKLPDIESKQILYTLLGFMLQRKK